ncbi:MAG: HD domain-containing phosphohydrolase [Stenotrophomonas sp.]|uniref:HD-GYP domain-containing protein n=1 Tax=Stenotrophomonas sp. TaxID=69392 RepID=UPI002FCA3796
MTDPYLSPASPALACSIDALSVSLQLRDAYTGHHCDRVGLLARSLARQCSLGAAQCDQIALAACFHDVGKIGIPDGVLLNPGRHDDAEQAIMRQHPEHGERIFLATGRPDAADVAGLIRAHHEAFDGSGYPDGLRGEHIPLGARILTLVDAWDAMTSDRPYRDAMDHGQVMRILDDASDGLVDPYLLGAFQALLKRVPALA